MSAQMQRHPGGRPTLYKPEYCEQIVAFCQQGYSLTGFAGEIGVARDTISEWMERHEEFSVAARRAKAACARKWEERANRVADEGGTGGQATITMFALKNHSAEDYRDKQEHEISGKDGAPLAPAVSVVIGAVAAPEPMPALTLEQPRQDGREYGSDKRPRGRPRKNKELAPR